MTQGRDNRGPRDRSRIDIGDDDEVRYWSRTLGVTPEQLRAVVQAVGSDVDTVRANIASASTTSNKEPLTPSGDQRIAVEE